MKPKLPTPTIADGRTLYTLADLRTYSKQYAEWVIETNERLEVDYNRSKTDVPDFLGGLFKGKK